MKARSVAAVLLVVGVALPALAVSTTAAATAPKAPAATTGAASTISYAGATLNAHVDPRGQEASFYFQYGTTTAYGAQTASAVAGSQNSSIKVAQAIAGLTPDTLYHFRVVAVNPTGTTVGKDRTFTTPKIPLSLSMAATPNPATFGQAVTIEGTLAGTEGAGREVVLQSNAYPFTSPTGFQTIGDPVVTGAGGVFTFPEVVLQQDTQLRVATVGTPVVISEVLTESVQVRVSFHVKRTKRRGYVRLSGTVTPNEVGAQVGFQLIRRGQSSLNQGGTVVKNAKGTSRYGVFSRVVHLHKYGLYRILVQAQGANAPGYSRAIRIHRQRG